MNHLMKLTAACAALMFSGTAFCADKKLYVVSGTPDQKLPVRVYSLDPVQFSPAKTNVQIADELFSVLADYDKRMLVIASPAIAPTQFSFMSMDDPGSIISRALEYAKNQVPSRVYALETPDEGFGIGVVLGDVTPTNEVKYHSVLTFLGLNSPGPTRSLPLGMLRYTRFSGEPGVVITQPETGLPLIGNPLSAVVGGGKIDLGVAPPPYLSVTSTSRNVLIANSDAFMIITPYTPPEAVWDVLNKSSNVWRRISIPFDLARVRIFGHWLAAIEMNRAASSATLANRSPERPAALSNASPGGDKRMVETIGPAYRSHPGITVGDLFDDFQVRGVRFPGELAIYNLENDTKLGLSTGSGDSEVVFVDDNSVFYRVDDAIFRRDIRGTSLGEPVKLAEGIEFVQVHWAFLN